MGFCYNLLNWRGYALHVVNNASGQVKIPDRVAFTISVLIELYVLGFLQIPDPALNIRIQVFSLRLRL